ncbi:hypothetical protein [Streptomyces sp. NPDC058861]|uniref:hypothetical protein n=1 Tax=Streptomyces sp. NPDC058861 TaxID=3346653 RepID=UPI0036A10F0A
MGDYDLSFERPADAVDAGTEARQGERWEGPDLRLRCTTTDDVYEWPECAPYNGGTTVTWTVRGYGSHAAEDDDPDLLMALCGFKWSPQEGRRTKALPSCRECLREVRLDAERTPGRR